MKNFFLVSVICAGNLVSFAQNKADSLEKKFNTSTDPAEKSLIASSLVLAVFQSGVI